MKGINFQSKIFHVSVPICSTFKDLYLVVEPFQRPCRYSVIKPIQNASTMAKQCFDKLPKFLNSSCPGTFSPRSQEFLGIFPVILQPELSQFFLQVVNFCQRFVDFKSLFKLLTFVFFIIQIFSFFSNNQRIPFMTGLLFRKTSS